MATKHQKPPMTRQHAPKPPANNTDRLKGIITLGTLVLGALKLLVQIVK